VVNFRLDTVSPLISLSLENKIYYSPDVPLDFTVNEQVSQITYSLDGQGNVAVAGNTTLTGLSVGVHNVTVYAQDAAGNVGASETITFTVEKPEPFPSSAVAVASTAVAAVIGVSLVVYFIKTRRKQKTKNVSLSTHIFKQ